MPGTSSPKTPKSEILGMPQGIFLSWISIAGIIGTLSLWPEGIVSDHYYLDKLAHIAAYATLAAIPALFLVSFRMVIYIATGLVLISAGLEFAQYFLPDRWPSLFDLGANIVGVVTGALAAWFLGHFLRAHRQLKAMQF